MWLLVNHNTSIITSGEWVRSSKRVVWASELGSCQSNLCNSWGSERLQKTKCSLKDYFENVNIFAWQPCLWFDFMNYPFANLVVMWLHWLNRHYLLIGGILQTLTFLIWAFWVHVPYLLTKCVTTTWISLDWFIQTCINIRHHMSLECFYDQTLYKWAATCDFQQCGILTSVDSDEPVQPHFKLRNSKWYSVSSLTLIEYSSD